MLVDLLIDEEYARLLGTGARSRCVDLFLGDRHLTRYVDLFEHPPSPAARSPVQVQRFALGVPS